MLTGRFAFLIVLLLTAVFAPRTAIAANQTSQVYLIAGENIAPKVKARVTELLKRATTVIEFSDLSEVPQGALVVSIGDTPETRRLISEKDLAAQGPEGFVVRTKAIANVTVIAATGNGAKGERTTAKTNRGVSFAAYEVLQQLGFHFYHPFTPETPKSLNTNLHDVAESPRWPVRATHLHTMHPIELSHVLNGWGANGPQDKSGFEAALADWDLYLEWLIAHRQNEVEWVLLADKTHTSFNDSSDRITRLKRAVDMAHAWGLLAGIDVGIVFEQQNMWRLLRNPGSDSSDSIEIRDRIRYLMKAGWDFMTAELGTSEFTSPNDTKQLFWMNVLTDEMERVYNREAAVKIHVTKGQTAAHFTDPDTGAPLNFNFLPMYADKKLVVLPHTVELYSLDDPAPTYGNTDWNEIHRFLSMQAGARPVLFYPESTYWVSYDIDTPLFLPSYAERRMHDLRLIAREEDAKLLGRGLAKGSRIEGQMLFTSGFEWGYWFNQLVAMHAAWNPRVNENERSAFENITREILRPSDDQSAKTTNALASLLSDTIAAQNDLLILGKVNGKTPRHFERLTGMAYMSGTETWDEINTSLADILGMTKASTQPNRLGFRSLRDGLDGQGVDYVSELHPLLDAMEVRFTDLSNRYVELFKKTPVTDSNKDVLLEFADGAIMNSLRASQVHALYDSVASPHLNQSPMVRDQKLARARHAVDLAVNVVSRRESHYRSKLDDISSWKINPTVYHYGYLWTVHSLYWWYRDEGNVTQQPPNACFMNIVNPGETAFADGRDNAYYQWAQRLADLMGMGSIKECLSPSLIEPQPRERVRTYEIPFHQ